MRTKDLAILVLLSLPMIGGAAKAETPEENAFGVGQFTGAATFCKLPGDQIKEVAATLLKVYKIDVSGSNPGMTRFTEGVTDGIKSMSKPDAASCDAVKAAFDDAYKKIHH